MAGVVVCAASIWYLSRWSQQTPRRGIVAFLRSRSKANADADAQKQELPRFHYSVSPSPTTNGAVNVALNRVPGQISNHPVEAGLMSVQPD